MEFAIVLLRYRVASKRQPDSQPLGFGNPATRRHLSNNKPMLHWANIKRKNLILRLDNGRLLKSLWTATFGQSQKRERPEAERKAWHESRRRCLDAIKTLVYDPENNLAPHPKVPRLLPKGMREKAEEGKDGCEEKADEFYSRGDPFAEGRIQGEDRLFAEMEKAVEESQKSRS